MKDGETIGHFASLWNRTLTGMEKLWMASGPWDQRDYDLLIRLGVSPDIVRLMVSWGSYAKSH